jgi:hypothetical protein
MKKSIVIFAFVISTFAFVSCKEEAKEETTIQTTTEVTHDHAEHEHGEGDMHMANYTCPMDCEKGKMYDQPGKCPVCEMDLIEISDASPAPEEN